MIRLEGVSLALSGETIVDDATFHLHPGDHVGLVGRNGSGKTTLLRAMVGEIGSDGGKILVRPGARVGWLPQQAVSGSTRTVWEEARSGMTRLLALETQLRAAEAGAGGPGGPERLERAVEQFRVAGGYAADEKVGEVLHGLGFGPDTWVRTCDTFSGGWQMRIALARLLLSDADVALLDEPTNHLDLEARSWLASYLANAPFAFVVVSHDRWLLDRCVRRVLEVRNGRVHEYAGNFASFLVQRELRREQAETAFGRQQAEIARLERFVDRFGAKATKAAAAKSKQKAIDRIERVEAPDKAKKAARLRLPEAPPGALDAIALVQATVGWDAPLLTNVDFVLERGMRVALLGPNGCGKSTLLRAFAGEPVVLAGRRRLGDRVRVGVFHQDLAQALPKEPSPLDLLTVENPLVPPERVRSVLGALGLPGDMALRAIGVLSGGEKARVALASLVLRPCNVLLLDEPTNHLDAETVDVLVEALSAFEGALLLVTHDRFVVERVATHVARVKDGAVDLRPGVRPEDFERPRQDRGSRVEVSAEATDHADRKRRLRELERAKRRLQEVQEEIPRAEAKVAALDDAMVASATDHVKVKALLREHEVASGAVEALYAEWEALEAG